MKTAELRAKYLAFFESKGHTVYPSGSLVPYDVTGRLDESLLFNGAGMVQFKPFFRGSAEPPNKRLATAQKCVRTGDIEEVGDLSHLTFFEMLGNFSFGDYFKKEAIEYSWEFLTSAHWLGLDPKKLSFTVFEEDEEAEKFWHGHIATAGIAGEARVFRLGEETNYWPAGAFSNGPPGPCGPNSEMFYWVSDEPVPSTQSYTREDWIRDEAEGKWLEIWNDVFIQSEWQGQLRNPDRPGDGYEKTGMPDLPFQSIDTGMGIERTAAVLGGFNSVYETDAFQGIIRKIEEVGSHGGLKYGGDPAKDRAIRIIADHIRTSCFCIADGILPANNGRGYVLRRLIRRAVLKGLRALDFREPFFHRIFEAVHDEMGGHYRELIERAPVIEQTLQNEEVLFRRTISQGSEMLTNWLDSLKVAGQTVLRGPDAFRLYDTYGFPLEVTQELCGEQGIKVDIDGYEVAMKEAQERSRGVSGMDTVYGTEDSNFFIVLRQSATTPTEFVGYHQLEIEATITAAVPETDETGASTGRFAVALDRTPFYAESGGQISDGGIIKGAGFRLNVVDIIKHDGVYVHLVEALESTHPEPFAGMAPQKLQEILLTQFFNQKVNACVDAKRRSRIIRHHTATHLLHAALRKHLGKHVTQAGSLVSDKHLRFDFTHGKALSPEEIEWVEHQVNQQALGGFAVEIHENLPIDHARSLGAMALFGEKYGDFVRVVEIRDLAGAPLSIELCGGCHVQNTGQIGFFKILHESSAASGVRRIEAVSGEAALDWATDQHQTLRSAAGLLKTTDNQLVKSIEKVLENLKDEKKKVERLLSQSGSKADGQKAQIGPLAFVTTAVRDIDPKEAQAVADNMVGNQANGVALVVVIGDGQATFIAKAGKAAVSSGVHCGNLVKQLASLTGGGGGGRPDFATAGAKQLDKLDSAMQEAPKILSAMVGA